MINKLENRRSVQIGSRVPGEGCKLVRRTVMPTCLERISVLVSTLVQDVGERTPMAPVGIMFSSQTLPSNIKREVDLASGCRRFKLQSYLDVS